MSATLEDIKEKAQQVSETERAELALALIESLDGPPDVDVEEAWRIEIDAPPGRDRTGRSPAHSPETRFSSGYAGALVDRLLVPSRGRG